MRSRPRLALARRLGKVPAVVGVCYGFVGNRMLARRSVEAERLLLEGALPHEVEAALVEFGLPMGPFAMMDLAGLDVGWLIRKSRGEAGGDRGRAVRGRAFRPEDRQGLFPLPGRLARADPRSRGRADHPRRLGPARHRAAQDRTDGDRRADDFPDDQRGRSHPRRGDRRAARRHRCDLGVWLWLAGRGAAARCITPIGSGSGRSATG